MVVDPRARRILPMTTAGTQHFIERTYREGGVFQWVRETYKNAIEADATKIEFGVEWQAVETLGVYRRVIADNGRGMTADQLVAFFNTFGGGGKPIGDVHENFGVGFKATALPWNKHGIVVISWVDGEASMIWIQHDPITGEYGLRVEEVEDENGDISLEAVYEPYVDDEHGCNWAAVKPDWIHDHGTAIVLLGNSSTEDTVLGDPSRPESDIKGISAYMNRRLWTIPPKVDVFVDELRTQDRGDWPRKDTEAHGAHKGGADRRTNTRRIEGAKYYIEYPATGFKGGRLARSGTVQLAGGVAVDWFLWDGARPAVQSYAAISGYIAAVYADELYDITSHRSVYRSFGVSEQSVRERLWLVICPPILRDDGQPGVYPRTDRNSLLLRGGSNPGGPLPIAEWATEFAGLLPDPILEAIRSARSGEAGTIDDLGWLARLAERFGARWRILKRRVHPGGDTTVDPTQSGAVPSKRRIRRKKHRNGRHNGNGGTAGGLAIGTTPGAMPAKIAKVAGGIPRYRLVRATELGPGMLAAWHPNDPVFPEGAVLVNMEHPVLEAQVLYWQGQFPDVYADQVRQDVLDTYGEVAVSKVAHSEHLKAILPAKTIEDELRSEGALTMALLGLIAEEALIAPRLGGKYGKKVKSVA